jgi:hypothetical protein
MEILYLLKLKKVEGVLTDLVMQQKKRKMAIDQTILDFGCPILDSKQATGFQPGENPKLNNRQIIYPKSKI